MKQKMRRISICRAQASRNGTSALARVFLPVTMAFAAIGLAVPADACTTFSIAGSPEKVFGKSYDWNMSHGFVVVNKRNVAKTAFALMPGDKPANWVSKFGSVTFNQYGREFPNGGINEAGLVVEVMILGDTRYPSSGSGLPTVNEAQWVQYQLDQYETVAQVAEHAGDLRISKVQHGLHYLVCDRTGDCGAIEWLDGRPVINRGDAMPHQALTNSTYASSLRELAKYQGFGGTRPVPPRASGSLERFVRAAASVKEYDPSRGPASEQAFSILDQVGSSGSQWQIVYESETGKAHFRTQPFPAIKSIDTTAFDFDCRSAVKIFDMDATSGGDVTDEFVDYTEAKNRVIVEKSLKGSLPQFAIDRAVKYPGTTTCQTKGED